MLEQGSSRFLQSGHLLHKASDVSLPALQKLHAQLADALSNDSLLSFSHPTVQIPCPAAITMLLFALLYSAYATVEFGKSRWSSCSANYGSISDVEVGMPQACCGNDRRVKRPSCEIRLTLQVATRRMSSGWHRHETDTTSDLEAIESGREDENFDPRAMCEPRPAVPAVAISHINKANEQLSERQTSAGVLRRREPKPQKFETAKP